MTACEKQVVKGKKKKMRWMGADPPLPTYDIMIDHRWVLAVDIDTNGRATQDILSMTIAHDVYTYILVRTRVGREYV